MNCLTPESKLLQRLEYINEAIANDEAEDKPSDEAYLVMKSVYYNQIKSGVKKVEYRDFTDYWVDRLLTHPLKTVKLNRGYTDEHMIFEIDWIGVISDNDKEIHAFDENGDMNEEGKSDTFDPRYISIHLGKRIK